MAPESARQRELYRYYEPWSTSFHSNKTSLNPESIIPRRDGHCPRSSADTTLTAFAQLGCLRLNVKRGLITLVASAEQYVLAEATRSLSLIQDNRHKDQDELWFGNAVLPRSQGVSEHALNPEPYTAHASDGSVYSTPAFVIRDLCEDERFKSRGYAGKGIRFYAGVPIVTRAGYAIGAYTVTDENARDGLSPDELKFMRDMALVVLAHLEAIRNDSARTRGERLVRGLGSFIEGRSSYATHSMRDDRTLSFPGESGSGSGLDRDLPQVGEEVSREFKGMTIQDANTSVDLSSKAFHRTAEEHPGTRESSPPRSRQVSPELEYGKPSSISSDQRDKRDPSTGAVSASMTTAAGSGGDDPRARYSLEYKQTFRRAAVILREAMDADGVIFFDASSANLGHGSKAETVDGTTITSHERASSTSVPSDSSSDAMPIRSRKRSRSSDDKISTPVRSRSPDRSELISVSSEPKHPHDGRCEVLGLSVKLPNGKLPPEGSEQLWIGEQDMRSCIKRYPAGKVFLFSQDRELSSSESELSPSMSKSLSTKIRPRGSLQKGKRHRTIANALIKVLPDARNIVFLPLWDFGKDRWSSGAFIWSTEPQRLLNAQDDLSYIKSFGNSIMNEVSRLHIVSADQAKASFLANISHELRSPLHGILGSVEFLQDTAVDAFQSGLITSVETCGKTLLDTVEHVLDYAKINQLSRKGAKRVGRGNKKGSQSAMDEKHSLSEDFNLATVVEEVVEAVFAGQTFRSTEADFSNNGNREPSPILDSRPTSATRRQMKDRIAQQSQKHGLDLNLTLDIDNHVDWHVVSQPGAVRRITMNLLGNALKYTEKGAVCVSLRPGSPEGRATSNPSRLDVCLTVSDTGRGMSDDFLRNHLFTPFTQEDSFASGTGLGLSIVQQIVTSLNGKIDLRSQKHVGTDVKVWLSLPIGRQKPTDSEAAGLLASVQKQTPGRVFCMLEPESSHAASKPRGLTSSDMPAIDQSVRSLATDWFKMTVSKSPTMKNVVADFFIYAEPPPIEYLLHEHGDRVGETEVPVIIMCTNAYESASLRANGIHHLTDIGRVIEVISQPCGPSKLARALHRCLRRIEKENEPGFDPSGPTAVSVCDKPSVPEENAHPEQTEASESESEANVQSEDRSHLSRTPEECSEVASESAEARKDSDSAGDQDVRQDIDPDTHKSSASVEEDAKQGLAVRLVRRNISASEVQHAAPVAPTSPQPRMARRITDPSSPPSIKHPPPSSHNTHASEPLRVLLVDDNPINLQLLVTFMRKTQTPYASAIDGLQALTLYKNSRTKPEESPFTHVLMDISMPVMDGLESTREIRKFEREHDKGLRQGQNEKSGARRRFERKVVIYALTGLGSEAVQRDAERSGMDGFLAKPIRLSMLRELLGIA